MKNLQTVTDILQEKDYSEDQIAEIIASLTKAIFASKMTRKNQAFLKFKNFHALIKT